MTTDRLPEYPVESLFVERWSPRSFTGEEISEDDLMSLFEAARWAPSCYNEQPWIFMYAKRQTPGWDKFFDLLVEFNRSWARKASVLMAVASSRRFSRNQKPNHNHSFDCGAAWENLALQACMKGWAAHGMAGFDRDKAVQTLGIPETHQIEAMIAVGRPDSPGKLPARLREREKPSDRNPVKEFAFEGGFPE